MLAVFDYVIDNGPISVEEEYVDTNGDRDPQWILVEHNHVEPAGTVGAVLIIMAFARSRIAKFKVQR